ncbi:HTA1 [Symbiodinium natans]|uniref:HTA1 protein n=1 Tax=Symbiodinium natans TaxID=878477 RepID=A0A812NHY7_9DINO|nr:HTA1 [Symbiodinium natans]
MALASAKTPRAVAPKVIATKKSMKVSAKTEGELDLDQLIGQVASVPVASFKGGRGSLPPCPGAQLKVAGPEEEATGKSLGRYATPSCGVTKTKSTGAHTPRRHSEIHIPGMMSPAPPSSPHSGRPKPPSKHRASTTHVSAEEVKNLDTQKLGVILRRGAGAELRDPESVGGRDDDDSEDIHEMPMIKSKTDPRSALDPVQKPTATAQVQKLPSQQEELVSRLFLSDTERIQRTKAGATSNEGELPEGLSSQRKKKLDGRRRSRELQAMIDSVENEDAETNIQVDEKKLEQDVLLLSDEQSKEDEYWSTMWQMTKDAMRASEAPQEAIKSPFFGFSGRRSFTVPTAQTWPAVEKACQVSSKFFLYWRQLSGSGGVLSKFGQIQCAWCYTTLSLANMSAPEEEEEVAPDMEEEDMDQEADQEEPEEEHEDEEDPSGRAEAAPKSSGRKARGKSKAKPIKKDASKGKKAPVRTEYKAGICFPVAKVRNLLKESGYGRVSQDASIYLTGVMEYVVAEILELAGNSAKEQKKQRILPRNIQLAIRNDEELNKYMANVTIKSGGVIPNIHTVLMPQKTSAKGVSAGSHSQEY